MTARTGRISKQGVIDDSDVFSIIIDPKDPNVVYASACSGIYKSETAGGHVSEDAGDSFHGAQNQRSDAGSAAPEHCLCREQPKGSIARAIQERRGSVRQVLS